MDEIPDLSDPGFSGEVFVDGDQHVVYSYSDNESSTFGTNQSLVIFASSYREVHGSISMALCVLGIVANVNNIVVLTHRKMISPANYILASIGAADICALLIYGMFAAYAFISKRGEYYEINQYKEWIDYAIAMKHLFHLFSICGAWLTIALAVFQYIQVCHIQFGQRYCTIKNSKIMIACTAGWSLISSIPVFIMYKSEWLPLRQLWKISETELTKSTPELRHFAFIFYGIILKLAACLLLVTVSTLLIGAIYRANKQSLLLRQNSRDFKREAYAKTRRRNRTTIMMISVLLLFVLSTLPSGIVALIAGCDDDFQRNVFNYLIEIFDLFVLINCAIKFVLYCSMSQEFRKVFVRTIDSNIRELLILLGFKNIRRRNLSRSSSISTGATGHTHVDKGEITLNRIDVDDDDDDVFHSLVRRKK